VKSEIVSQLLADKASEALVKAALHDNDVQVRKGVITNTKSIEPALRSDYETLLTDSSYITIATALEKLCASFPENTARYLAITKGIEGTNGRNVQIKWIEISLTNNEDASLVNQLVAFTSDSYEFVTRGNAMAATRRLNCFSEKLINNCLNACLSSNGRLSGPATETVKYFYAQDKNKKLIEAAIAHHPAEGKDHETLNKLIN
jgi:hypothetical protein